MASGDHLLARVRAHLLESAEVKRLIADEGMDAILAAARTIADSLRAGGKLLLCGNGGSAADCQHVAAEFVSRLTGDFERPGLPAIALTTDTSFLTAYANDYSFEGIFERQVEALGKQGDVLMGISTSGGSRNVIRAVEMASAMGLRTIVLTGSGGPLVAMADVALTVPSGNTQYIQEAHLAMEHVVVDLAERYLGYGQKKGAAPRRTAS
ncbi:MAG: D-sedoheptulose-7-phosphate isomerase [Chloroflexota bacterium]